MNINTISPDSFCKILTYLFGDIYDTNGKHWLNGKSLEDRYKIVYRRINLECDDYKYDVFWNMLTISNMMVTSKNMNKRVFNFLRYTGIVQTTIDYRNNWIYLEEIDTPIQLFVTNFINNIMFNVKKSGRANIENMSTYFWVNFRKISREKIKKDRLRDYDYRWFSMYNNEERRKIWEFNIPLQTLITKQSELNRSHIMDFHYCTHHWCDGTRCGNIVEYKYDTSGKRISGQSFHCFEHETPNIYGGKLLKPATIKCKKL